MTSIKNIDNIKVNEKIEALWIMQGDTSVVKDYITREIHHYLCYCDSCIEWSSGGKGGRVWLTAEDLLAHRNMKAFKCPLGCHFHVCNKRKTIIGHLKHWHEETLEALIADGLYTKQCWIYPNYTGEGSYTLTNPMTDTDSSPMQMAGEIIKLSLSQPQRVSRPSVESESKQTKAIANSDIKAPWANVKRQGVSLNEVMKQQMVEVEEKKPIVHYAQEDMYKEKQCENGKDCIHKKLPFRCALNHDGKGEVIKRGTPLMEDVLCPHERPPFKRCWNTLCTKIHLQNRAEFIEEKKKEYYANKDSVKRDETSINITSQGIHMSISNEKMKGIAALSSEDNHTTDSDSDEHHNDISDAGKFANRAKKLGVFASA